MNSRKFINIIFIILALTVVSIIGYFILSSHSIIFKPKPSVVNKIPANWQIIDADSFTLALPSNWQFNKLQGMDSYVGEFVGDEMKLNFDFGWYSNSLAGDNDPNYIVTYEDVNDRKAKIVVPKVAGKGMTGVYFDNLGGKGAQQTRLNLYGENFTSSQQEIALKIFRTIQIVKSVWP